MLFDERLSQIQHLIDINRHVQARQLAQEGLNEAPTDASLLFYLSLICFIEDDHEMGAKIAESGLAYAPKNQDLRHILFKHLQALKQFADAELLIIDLIRDNPRNAEYLSDYAQLMLYTFHVKKARALVNEALRLSPTDTSAMLIDVLIDITQGDLDESELTLRKLVDDDPQSEHVLRLLLMQLIEKKRFRSALLLTQELLRRNPLDTELVDIIVNLRTLTHWSAIPLWPLQKLGLMGTFLLWLSFVLMITIDRFLQWPYFSYAVFFYLGFCLYSWIHEPIVSRIIKAKGV